MTAVEYSIYQKMYILNFYLYLSSDSPEILEYADFRVFDREPATRGVPVCDSFMSVCDLFRFLNLFV